MRVVLPAWRMLSPRGGVGRILCHLLEQYARLAPDDTFMVLHDGAAELPVTGHRAARRVRAWPLETMHTWHHLALPRAVAAERGDVLHNLGYILPRGVRGPSVVTVHDVAFVRHPEWFPRRIARFLADGARHAAARADALVTDSEFSAIEIADLLGRPRERIDVVPLAAGPEFSPTADAAGVRARYGLPERFVLYLGDVRPRRRVDQLVTACGRVLPHRDAWLVTAGGTRDTGYDLTAHAAEVGLGERLRVLGYVPEADLPGLYAAATAFCWPSIYEGFGLPPLEALASGTPTIVADAASLPETVGDAALKVRPDDLDELAEALAGVLDDDGLRAELRAAGLEQAAGFSWRTTATAMLGIYRRVAESPR